MPEASINCGTAAYEADTQQFERAVDCLVNKIGEIALAVQTCALLSHRLEVLPTAINSRLYTMLVRSPNLVCNVNLAWKENCLQKDYN